MLSENLGPVAEAVTDRKLSASAIAASNSLLRTWLFAVDNSGSLCLISSEPCTK